MKASHDWVIIRRNRQTTSTWMTL